MHRSTLPSHYTKKEHALDVFLGERFSEHLRILPNKAKNCLNPMLCDEKIISTLAQKKDTEFWSDVLNVEDKRRLVFNTINIKRHAGTTWALKKAIESLGIETSIHESESIPFHFSVLLGMEDREITPKLAIEMQTLVHKYKNVRSILDELSLSYLQKHNQIISVGGVGEVNSHAEQIEGYVQNIQTLQTFSVGAVGQTTAYALQEV